MVRKRIGEIAATNKSLSVPPERRHFVPLSFIPFRKCSAGNRYFVPASGGVHGPRGEISTCTLKGHLDRQDNWRMRSTNGGGRAPIRRMIAYPGRP